MSEIQFDTRTFKYDARALLRQRKAPIIRVTVLLLVISMVLNLIDAVADSVAGVSLPVVPPALSAYNEKMSFSFVTVLVLLLLLVLRAGYTLYLMYERRGEKPSADALFDGFSFAGRIIWLGVLEYIFIVLWTMAFIIPGFVAAYRYRFALYNLCENPELTASEAIRMSKQQTMGYKWSIFGLDVSFLLWALLAALPSGLLLGIFQSYFPVGLVGNLLYIALDAVLSGVVTFYLMPYYRLADLNAFALVKRASGVGVQENAPAPEEDFFKPEE